MSNKNDHKILRAFVIAGFTAITVHVMNTIISSNALSKNKLGSVQEEYYDWRFGRVFYTKKGSGDPLLLIHDLMPGMAGYEWQKVEHELAKSYTVYTIDLLGCGRSNKSDITYSSYLFVQLLTDFVKHVIQKPVNIAASGFSSTFAAMACLNDPDAFHKIIMINPPDIAKTEEMPEEKDRIFRRIIEMPIFGTLIYNMVVSKENVTNLFVNKLFYNPFHVERSLIDTYYESSHKGYGMAKYLYASTISKYLSVNLSNALKKLEHPLLIITGEDSNDKKIAETYLEFNELYQMQSIPKTMKLPHYESPELFLNSVKQFLQE